MTVTPEEIERAEAAAAIDDDLDGDAAYPSASPGERSMVYSIRIPVGRLEQLRRTAAARGLKPTAMIRDWVLGRLDKEVGGSAEPAPTSAAWRRAQCIRLINGYGDTPETVPIDAVSVTDAWVTTREGDTGAIYPVWRVHEVRLAEGDPQ